MNWFSILKYSVILFVAQTAVGTITSLLVGADNLATPTLRETLIYQYVPFALIGILVLAFYAKNQVKRTFSHLLVAVLINALLGFVIVSVLMGELYFPPLWIIDLSIAAITILVANFIGRHFRGSDKNAT